jgi:hypothetical protein
LGARLEATPQRQLLAQALGFAQDLLGRALIVPEARFADVRIELGQAVFLCLEVKDAPMLPGSVLPDRGFRPAPLGAASRVLEKDRSELDETKCALAPGNYGVHAGAVDVVSANAAVTIAVEGRRVTTATAVSLTGDEIDECRFFCLLHYSPQCDGNRPSSKSRLVDGP